jgi:NADH-quinone oxidoreductase subunit G
MAVDPALPRALANLVLLAGKTGRANSGVIVLSSGGNSRGAHDMGVRPDLGPGGASVSRRGLSAAEMWAAAAEKKLQGMFIAGLNPAQESAAVAQALDALEFLVVQDAFLTETAQRADLVLPMLTFAEREGSFTNAERRVQRFLAAAQSEQNLPALWESLQQVARLLQEKVAAPAVVAEAPAAKGKGKTEPIAAVAPADWDYAVVSDLADEICATVRGYQPASYTSLGVTNQSWGRQTNEAFYYDGTSYTNTLGVGVQLAAVGDSAKGAYTVAFRAPQAPAVDDRFPLTLLTAVRAYDGGDWSRGSKLLTRTPPAHVILSVADAQRLKIGMGEAVRVESARGALTLPAQIDAGLAAGMALLPLVRGAGYGDLVTGAATPVAIRKAE